MSDQINPGDLLGNQSGDNQPGSDAATPVRPSRRWRWLAAAASLLLLLPGVLYLVLASASFERFIEGRIVHHLAVATGARVELGSFHWQPLALSATLDNLTLHGREQASEQPWLHVDQMRVRLSILGLLTPRLRLSELVLSRPALHTIIYADGSTNQPQPQHRQKSSGNQLDTFFKLQAGHFAIEQGDLHTEYRAAEFDFQSRHQPLSLAADDLSVVLGYQPATAQTEEFYRITLAARDLLLARDTRLTNALAMGKPSPAVHGYLEASIDLWHHAAQLRSLRITGRSKDSPDRTLEITGRLDDFTHPRWTANIHGQLDMRLIEPITGYPFTPEGIANLQLAAAGWPGTFRIDGAVHATGAAYIGTGVYERGIDLDTHVHADPNTLQISRIAARLHQGGEIDGDLTLIDWLKHLPPQMAHLEAPGHHEKKIDDPIEIPVNGTVHANFRNVALETVLSMVSLPPFQHLGLDARVNGPAEAHWRGGDVDTLAVSAQLALTPPSAPIGVPTSGRIDATYTQHDGAVDLRALELHMPASELIAHGHLGAYPMMSPTAINVDLRSSNLAEFDTLFNDLGLVRNGKHGAAALPVNITGQAEFHGQWNGALLDPHLNGALHATRLSVELPRDSATAAGTSTQPNSTWVYLDAIDGNASYSAQRISIDHATLRQAAATLSLDGTLSAPAGHTLGLDAPADLHAHVGAQRVDLAQMLALANLKAPVTGLLSADLNIDGTTRAPRAAGSIDLEHGTLWQEPVEHLHLNGSLNGDALDLHSVELTAAAGKLSAHGSYNLTSHAFQLPQATVSAELAHLATLTQQKIDATGHLSATLSGSGTLDDPRLEAHATLNNLSVAGEPLGNVELSAHSTNRVASYLLSTHFDAAALTLNATTALSGDYQTDAHLNFARFDIGALLRLAHVRGLSGTSSLAGSVAINGPLRRPEQLHGEAHLDDVSLTLSGVHLHSSGPLHARLDHRLLVVDPLHVMGEDTDVHLSGQLGLHDKYPLDLAASGSINLKIAQTIDPDLTASGQSTFQIDAHGPLANPDLRGRIDIANGALALEDLTNGLSQLHGTLEFNQNRLEVRSLTAVSGGGQISLGGYLSYQRGLFANLSAKAQGIRIRYPEGVSSLADASLHLEGSQQNMLLSGNVLITRFAISPDLDITALAAQSASATPIAAPDAPSNHVRLDVHIQSSPQLNFQNAYAKLAGDADLRLRGTIASPSLLGRVSITEGSAMLAGTRYDLEHGEINFTNPVRIQPNIDLNATARVEDYDISLSLRGTPDKLAVSYRSDPPLPESDVIALLALGRTENQQRIYTQQQKQTNAATDALLGGALNATVSSRVQKLFGAGSVKVDPNYLGALGNSTSRVIVEEQLGRNLKLTYATNVNTTGQQLLEAEVAINHHVSLLVSRDESGVFSMVLKMTRRYR